MRTRLALVAPAATAAVLTFGSTAQAFWPLVTTPQQAPAIVTPPATNNQNPTPTPPVVIDPPPPPPPYCPPTPKPCHNTCQTPEPSTLMGGLTGLAAAFGWATRRRVTKG